jgi:hypothetical protein
MKLIFAWYDFWIGAYFDRASKRLYVFPVPMVGIVIDFTKLHRKPRADRAILRIIDEAQHLTARDAREMGEYLNSLDVNIETGK